MTTLTGVQCWALGYQHAIEDEDRMETTGMSRSHAAIYNNGYSSGILSAAAVKRASNQKDYIMNHSEDAGATPTTTTLTSPTLERLTAKLEKEKRMWALGRAAMCDLRLREAKRNPNKLQALPAYAKEAHEMRETIRFVMRDVAMIEVLDAFEEFDMPLRYVGDIAHEAIIAQAKIKTAIAQEQRRLEAQAEGADPDACDYASAMQRASASAVIRECERTIEQMQRIVNGKRAEA